MCRSISRGCSAVFRLGITTMALRSSSQCTNLSLSYPLSAIIHLPRRSKCHCGSLVSAEPAAGFPDHPLPHEPSCSILPGCVPVLLRPFFAPLPCWRTLIVVLSSIRALSSAKSWAINSSKTYSQRPCRLHRRNRVYTLFHGPYRSGRSRRGIPVFSQYRIPLSITLLSFPGLPPCAAFLAAAGLSPYSTVLLSIRVVPCLCFTAYALICLSFFEDTL